MKPLFLPRVLRCSSFSTPVWPSQRGLATLLPKNLTRPAPSFPSHGRYAVQSLHGSTQSTLQTELSVPPDFAFVFDIDGVLLRSSKNLPGAAATLRFLHNHSIPFILLTNGGGKHETERVAELSATFGIPLTIDNFVQSHTPFQEMVHGSHEYPALEDKAILVTGNDQERVRDVAHKYGFKNVVTPGDILTAYPTIWPFSSLLAPHYKSLAQPLPSNPLKIDAIFVYSDPHDWALDMQVILDLLLSKDGILNTYSPKNGDKSLPNNGWQQDGQPKLIFSNPDLFWASSHPLPRLGQGGFRAALQGIWQEMTGGAELAKLVIGKPTRHTYLYAEHVLQKHRAEVLRELHQEVGELRTVYMVGDNPESDIRGANEFVSPHDTTWESVLVRTGVWREGQGRTPKYTPKALVDNVQDGVKWALRKQRYKFDEKEFED